MKRVPDGVRLIAIYHIAMVVPGLIGSCAIFLSMVSVAFDADWMGATWAIFGMSVGLFFTVLLAFAFPVVGIGLWRLWSWARWAAILLAFLLLPAFPIWTGIGLAVIWYLFQEEAKRAFGAG